MSKRPPILTPYDMGYGKPPEAHRFKPGQSGNPKRRTKKVFRPVAISVSEELNRITTVRERNISVRLPIGTIVAKRVIAEVARGNTRALQSMLNLLASLPPELQDQAIKCEKHQMALDLVTGLLDKYARFKQLYGDLPLIVTKTSNEKNSGSG